MNLNFKTTCRFLACTITIALLLNLFFELSSSAQTQTQVTHGFGAKLVSDAAYNKYPKVNWDTLKKYAPHKDTSSGIKTLSVNGITMLENPPVGDQGLEGSCVGWSVGYTAMGILLYNNTGSCWNASRRSPAYVFNQIKLPPDCHTGSVVSDGLNLVKNSGVCSWNAFPYVDMQCNVVPTAAQNTEAGLNKATSWVTLTKTDVTGMKNALDLGYPIVLSFEVYQSFMDMWNNNTAREETFLPRGLW